jgi:hypothetical protein
MLSDFLFTITYLPNSCPETKMLKYTKLCCHFMRECNLLPQAKNVSVMVSVNTLPRKVFGHEKELIRTISCFIICPLSQPYYDYKGRDNPDICHARASEKCTQNSPPPIVLQPFVGPWTLFKFLDIFTQSVVLLGRGINPSQGRYLHIEQDKHRINLQNIQALSGIRPPDSIVRASKNSSCLRLRSHCDRPKLLSEKWR